MAKTFTLQMDEKTLSLILDKLEDELSIMQEDNEDYDKEEMKEMDDLELIVFTLQKMRNGDIPESQTLNCY